MRGNSNIEGKKEEEEIKFLADRMLGKLMKWLRILDYDTTYPFIDDLSLILMARQENRILLTRDTNLIKRRNICNFLFIKSDRWEEQLLEVIKALKLKIEFDSKIFSRCSLCNTPTKNIEKKEVKIHVPHYVFLTQDKFVYCSSCKKYYWRGTHWQRMIKKIKTLSLSKAVNDS